MKRLRIREDNLRAIIKEAVKVLKSGGTVIYPTETCYGIGVEVTNQQAVDRLLEYKTRPEGKAISIAVYDQQMAEKYVFLNETAKNLYENFLPGPLTVVSKSRGKVASGLEAEDGTLGVRIPHYPLALRLIKALGRPITATSANVSSKKTPHSLEDILKNTTKKQQTLIDLILDAGKLPKNPPSTVVDTTLNELSVIRKGEIDLTRPGPAGLQGRALRKEISHSEEETQKIAQKLTKSLFPRLKDFCIIFALQGELGVGKTQFAKGVAKTLGIRENIVSPTFVLLREYKITQGSSATGPATSFLPAGARRLNRQAARQRDPSHLCHPSPQQWLYHIDTWRMREGKELLDLGFYKMLKPGNVLVVEWLQKVRRILEEAGKRKGIKVVWVIMKYEAKNKRRIEYIC